MLFVHLSASYLLQQDDEELDDDYESPYSGDDEGSGGDYETPNDDPDGCNDYEPPPSEPLEDHKLCPTLPIADSDYIGNNYRTNNNNWVSLWSCKLIVNINVSWWNCYFRQLATRQIVLSIVIIVCF